MKCMQANTLSVFISYNQWWHKLKYWNPYFSAWHILFFVYKSAICLYIFLPFLYLPLPQLLGFQPYLVVKNPENSKCTHLFFLMQYTIVVLLNFDSTVLCIQDSLWLFKLNNKRRNHCTRVLFITTVEHSWDFVLFLLCGSILTPRVITWRATRGWATAGTPVSWRGLDIVWSAC